MVADRMNRTRDTSGPTDREGLFIAFGVGVGNFSSRREKMEKYVRETNQRLSLLSSPTKIIDWFGQTGNFVVHAPKRTRWQVADELSLALQVRCAVQSVDQVEFCVSIAEKAKDLSAQAGVRWTKGIAFHVKGKPCTTDLKPSPRAEFFRINEFAVGVYKKDQLTDEGVPDRANRSGGWGAVSNDIARTVGGVWTARSLMRVQGVMRDLRKHRT
jgi:hypothetical protein